MRPARRRSEAGGKCPARERASGRFHRELGFAIGIIHSIASHFCRLLFRVSPPNWLLSFSTANVAQRWRKRRIRPASALPDAVAFVRPGGIKAARIISWDRRHMVAKTRGRIHETATLR